MTNARSSRRLVRSLLGGTLLIGVLSAIGLGTIAAVAPTMASADTGTTGYSCSLGGTLPINVTGSIPSSIGNGNSFNISNYQAQITIPAADVQTIESDFGTTTATGSVDSTVNMLGATPSSMNPSLGNFSVPLPNPAADVTIDVPSSATTLGPFTATSSSVAAEAGEVDVNFTDPSGISTSCQPPLNLAISQTAVTDPGPFALVADANDGTVTAFDPTNGQTGTALPFTVGGNPDYVAMIPDGTEGLVSTWPGDAGLVPVNTTSLKVGTPINITSPRGVAISPDGSTAWVAGGSGDDSLYPVNLSNDSVGSPISLFTGGSAASVAITPDDSTAYVVGQFVGLVKVDLGEQSAEDPIAMTGSDLPGEVQITPDGKTAIVTDGDTLNYVDISQDPPVVVGTSTPCSTGNNLSRIAITPDGSTVWVACSDNGTAVPVDIASETAGTPVNLGTGSDSLGATAISPDGSTFYVSDLTADTVIPVNTSTDAVGTSIPTGASPSGIGLPPDQGPKAFLSVTSDQGDPQGLTEDFDASGSQPGSSPIVSYKWDFGDGSTQTTTVPTTSHPYATAGTYTATVTETDAAGTSTTVVSTGQEILRNGSAAASASASFTLSSCATGCTPTQSNGNTTSQVVQEGSTTGTLTLSVAPGQLDCVANSQQQHQITTLTESSAFSSPTPIQTKETITGLATTKGVKVCYQPGGASPPAPKYLKVCSKKHHAPCVVSTMATGPGTIVATLDVPPGDPRYWVDTGILGLTTFTPLSGKVGTSVTIKGTNLKQVTSVLFTSAQTGRFVVASALTISTATAMKVKVPQGAVTGPIEVVTNSGSTYTSTKSFTVTG